MERHFTFGHTIAPQPTNQQNNDDLLDLFRIGDQKINLEQKQERQESNYDQDSDQTVKNKKIKKQKKQKKEKKEKKQHKQKDKKDKSKKQKKEKKDKKKKERSHSQSSGGNLPLALIEKTKKIELYQKYAKALDHTSLDEKLTHKFQLNLKLGEGMLNVDIIRFPEPRLYQYGPMDKEIPRYQRLANFQKIIGFEKVEHRKGKQLIRDLNKIINQKNIVYNEDQISKDRYFDYKGYENVGFEKLAREKKLLTSESLLKFNLTEAPASTEEENVLKITKEFNRRINENPKDINLWLEFIGIQDTFSLSIGSLKNKAAVIDRKISIIEKALSMNQLNERLGLLYLGFLFEKQQDHKEISKKCMEFIMQNPASISLWKFYFSLSIEQFSTFSHPYIRKVFEEMNNLFKKLIEKTKSAIQIWKIRKASLEVLKNMLHIYKLQGYGQLATGIIVALLEYNIFMPQEAIKINQIDQKLKHFQKYWQDYTTYKLGDTRVKCNWSNIVTASSVQQQKFIGSFVSTSQVKHRNPVMRQIMESQQRWRMSNAVKDQQLLQQLPQSFILYDDIDFALMLYRDNDSLVTLIDIMADHLQLPQVFSTSNIYTQFNYKVTETVLKRIFNHKNCKVEGTNYQRYSYFWTKYWNPSFTDFIFPEHNIIKIEYFRRILISIKQKLPVHKSKINQYLSFLICAIYLSPKMQKNLCVSEQETMDYLSQIIKDEPLNIATWCIYIQATYTKKQNKEECVQCFLQLFDTVKLLIADTQQQKRLNFEILFWLTEFTRVHQLDIGIFLLKMYKKMVFDEAFNTQLIETLNGFDCLQLQQYFIDQIDSLLEQKSQTIIKQAHIQRYRSILFLLFYLQEFPFSSLTVLKDKIAIYFIEQLPLNPPTSQFFILKMLTSYRLLTFEDIIKHELLRNYPYLMVVQYWISSFRKPLMLLQGEFVGIRGKNLTLWMVCSIFIWRSQINHDQFYDLFYISSKKLCFEDGLNDQHPQYIALLNELLIYDVNDNHSKFIMYSLHHIPFSKKLYLLNLMLSETPGEKQKLVTLIHQKSIRVLDHSILS